MIYFIQAGKNGPVKIGQSDNPDERLAQLQTANPYELKLLWVYSCNSYSEAEIHERFQHERIHGEWFHPSREIKEFICDELSNYFEIKLNNHKNNDSIVLVSEHLNGSVLINIGNTTIGYNRITRIWKIF